MIYLSVLPDRQFLVWVKEKPTYSYNTYVRELEKQIGKKVENPPITEWIMQKFFFGGRAFLFT